MCSYAEGSHLSGHSAALLWKATFCGCTGPLEQHMGLLQRLSAVALADFILSDQPGRFPESRLAPLGKDVTPDSARHPRTGGFCTDILSVLILAHADILSVWAPDEPHCGQMDGCHQGKASRHSMPFPFSGCNHQTEESRARERRPP